MTASITLAGTAVIKFVKLGSPLPFNLADFGVTVGQPTFVRFTDQSNSSFVLTSSPADVNGNASVASIMVGPVGDQVSYDVAWSLSLSGPWTAVTKKLLAVNSKILSLLLAGIGNGVLSMIQAPAIGTGSGPLN